MTLSLPFFIMLLTVPALAGEVLQSVTTFVHGEILQIDGPYYTVKDQSGREVRLHVDGSTTKMDEAALQVGDRIAADVTPKGHVGLIVKEQGK
jgi:hypothetical protein